MFVTEPIWSAPWSQPRLRSRQAQWQQWRNSRREVPAVRAIPLCTRLLWSPYGQVASISFILLWDCVLRGYFILIHIYFLIKAFILIEGYISIEAFMLVGIYFSPKGLRYVRFWAFSAVRIFIVVLGLWHHVAYSHVPYEEHTNFLLKMCRPRCWYPLSSLHGVITWKSAM